MTRSARKAILLPMIITFKSRATADVIMFSDVAERIIAIIRRPPGLTGIITVEQLPDAIERLRSAVADERRAQSAGDVPSDDIPVIERTSDGRVREFVSLARRVQPLIEMMEYSLKEGKPVTWEA